MAPSVRRRLTQVNYAKELIKAIHYIRSQKQIPNFERISRQLQRSSDIAPRRTKEHLNNAVSDGLIMEYTAVGSKGSRTGLEQEGYRLPNGGEVEECDDGHDWYCFECHRPGEVYECSGCFRVFHQDCTREDTSGEKFTCSHCRASVKKSKMRKKMNTLLSYTMIHLKEQTKELYKLGNKGNLDDINRYVYKKMDLYKIEQKVQASKYKCLDDFLADARIILHNCVLLFGAEEKGTMTELATVMVKACKYDIEEIDVCSNCYYMSNAKPEDWFCQPCNPPHDLVFAKQKGYSYWPAKVVRDFGGKFDVRFFGGWHQRAVIPAEYIRPITTDVKSLSIKKTSGFTNAMKELKLHQKLLEERERELEATNGSNEQEEEEDEEVEEEEDNDKEQEMEEQDNTADGNVENVVDDSNVIKEDDIDEELDESMEDEVKVKKPTKSTPRAKVKSAKKGRKRSRQDSKTSNDWFEDDVDNRQVTSTSVDKQAKKRKRNSAKVGSQDECIQVTSSVDKVTSHCIATMNAAVQTSPAKTDNHSVQTDAVEDKTVDEHKDMKVKTEDMKDKFSEERMASSIADLTRRLEEKFEEDKADALKELSQRLEEDFGKDKQQAVERAISNMKQEVDKARKMGEDSTRSEYMEEMKKLATRHKEAIAQTKKKQWCFNCGKESMYHCCWNTSYCSHTCQQEHWHGDHKRNCRRKRPTSST